MYQSWACNQLKPTNGQWITLKKTRHLNELYNRTRNTVMWHWSVDTLYDSCQLTIASNAQLLQENS